MAGTLDKDATPAAMPDLLLIVYDRSPTMRDPFIRAVLKSLHLSVGPNTTIAAHEHPSAGVLQTALPFAVALAHNYLRQLSLDLQADQTEYERFHVVSPLEAIEGHAFAMFGESLRR